MAFSELFAAPAPTSAPSAPSATPAPAQGSGFGALFAAPKANDQKIVQYQRDAAQADAATKTAQSPTAIVRAAIPAPSDILGGFKSLFGDVKDAITAPAPQKSSNPIIAGRAAVGNAEDVYLNTINDAGARLANAVSTVSSDHASALDKGVSVASAGLGAVNSLFAPFTAALSGASRLPVVGHVADAVNNFFGAIGTVGADGAEGLVDSMPFPDEVKSKLMQPARELGALTAQIVAGKGGEEAFGKVSDTTQRFMTGVNDAVKGGQYVTDVGPVRQVPVQGESVETPVVPSNKYQAPDALPSIDMGSPAPFARPLPSIEEGAPLARSKTLDELTPAERTGVISDARSLFGRGMDFQTARDTALARFNGQNVPRETPEMPVSPSKSVPTAENAPTAPVIPAKSAPGEAIAPETAQEQNPAITKAGTPRAGSLKAVEGTGETKTRGLSQGVEAKAIENGLTDTFGQLPEYKTVNMADQAARASRILETDPGLARDIALGNKRPPADVLPESVLVAVERKAIAEGDVETLRELATNSRLTYEATTMGQRIRTLAERDPASPVGAIKAVQDAREAAIKARNIDVERETEATVKEMRAEVKRVASSTKRPTWEEFVKNLTCNI